MQGIVLFNFPCILFIYNICYSNKQQTSFEIYDWRKNMAVKIENKYLSIEVKEMGAELSSIYYKENAFEYLWQGNPDIWYGQSPILFPIIGRLLNDKYRFNSKEYTMPKHGLARKRLFKLLSKTDTEMVFIQTEDERTLKSYPFSFNLIIKYTIDKNILTVTHTVENTNDTALPFSLGAHPGFNCEIGDYLEFLENETLTTEMIDSESLRVDEKFPVLNNENRIVITDNIFDNDALILSGIKSKKISLKSHHHNRTINFDIGNAPYLGIWAKPGAPYVCIEPWFGVNDSHKYVDDISKKEGILTLEPKNSFSFSWSAEIN